MNIVKKEVSAARGYDMRAQPRRRLKEENEQPLFLKKAFNMIESCPPDLGGWSEKGDTFIVKDVKIFSEQIIPTVFKHNNFSSFVRQLNFYGFRKIKSELYSHNTQWWEFRHPHFIRGQPELLSEIRRAVHYAAVPQDQGINTHEMDSLKAQIASLASRLSAIDGSVIGISKVVGNLMMEGHKKKYEVDMKNENCGKKRRRIPPSSVELSENGCQPNRGQSSQQYCTSYSSDSDDTYDEISESYSVSSDEQPGATKLTDLPRGSELRQMEVLNCDFFRMSSADLLEDDLSIEFDDFLGLPAGQILEVNVSEDKPNNENISTSPVQRHDGFLAADVAVVTKSSPAIQLPFSLSKASDMTDILQYLSRDMQERFVDKLAESVGSHYAKLMANTTTPSVPTVNIPAAPAMSMNNYSTQFLQQMQNQQCQSTFQQFEQQNVLNSNNGSNYESYSQITPSMALPLASAALCSLIAVHCNGSNANSATCLAVKAATTAAGVTCHNGVCLPTFCNSANV